MKKTVAVILIIVLITGCFVGCGKDRDNVPTAANIDGDGCVIVDADNTPSAARTSSPTVPAPTQTPEPSPTATAEPVVTPEPATPIPTASPTAAPTAAPTPAPTPTPTPKPTPTPTPKPTPTPEPIENLNYIPGYVNTDGVNMRVSPSTSASILNVYNAGKNLYITGRNSEWYRVEADGMTGYIVKRFVNVGSAATPTPKPTAKPTPTPTPKPTPTPTPKPTPVPDYYTVYAGEFSESDIILVAKLLTSEGPGSTYVGLRAIASVVLNRVKNQSGHFPNTVPGVIYQSGQFYPEGALDHITPTNLAIEAARYVFSQHGATLPKKVLFYKASYLGTTWYSYLQYYCTIEANNYFLAIGGGF